MSGSDPVVERALAALKALSRPGKVTAAAVSAAPPAKPEPKPATARERALSDPLVREFLEAFDGEVLSVEDLAGQPPVEIENQMTLKTEDLPALKARLEAQGWRVSERHGEVVCVPGPPSPPRIAEAEETAAFPTERCRNCRNWIFWVSVDGAIRCATCHPPARLALVAHWFSVPEGQMPGNVQ